MYRYLTVALLTLLTALPLVAQEADAPAEEQDPLLENRRRTAHALEFLLRSADQNLHGFVLSPAITPVYKKVTRRYRKIPYTVRIPIYEYEMVEVMRTVGQGSARRMVKTQERRPVRITGYNEEERYHLRLDPEGDIERVDNIPVMDSANLERGVGILPGYLGYNGMALHVLLSLGVPADDQRVTRLVASLSTYIMVFGIPDSTFDVAWLTAGFTKYPVRSETLDTIRLHLLRKLLAGQVKRDVRVPGLWGAACMDHESVSIATASLLKEFKEVEALEAELKLAQQKKKERDIEKLEAEIAVLKREISELTNSLRFLTWRNQQILSNYRHRVILPLPGEGELAFEGFVDELYPIRLENDVVDILRENVTDLEVTAIALFALAEAEANGFLPSKIPRPDVAGKSLRPIDTKDAIEDAFKAVVACYEPRAKGWRMGIQWVNMRKRYYENYEHILPIEDAKLKDEVSAMADAAAFQALRALDRIEGLDDLSKQSEGITKAIEARLEEEVEALRGMVGYSKLLGRDSRNYYTYLAMLRGFQWSLSGKELKRPEAFITLSTWLGKRQEADGGWGSKPDEKGRIVAYTGIDTLGVRKLMGYRWEERQRQLDQDKKWPYHVRYIVRGPQTYTLDIIRYLENGSWPAVAVHWNGPGMLPKPEVLPRALRYLNHDGASLSYVSATEWPPPHIRDVPTAVVVTGAGPLTAEQQAGLSPLFPYIKAGGVLVVEAPANDAGTAFASSIADALGPALENRSRGPAPEDSYLFDSLEKKPPMQAVMREDGTIAALFLLIGPKNEGSMMTRGTAGRVLESVMKARLPPLLLDPRYPVLDNDGMPFSFPDPESDEPPPPMSEDEITE